MIQAGERTARPRVLCVDDEPNVLQGLLLHLRRRYDVRTASSGSAALEIIAREGAPTVVLSDMRMPGMDGATLLAEVRRIAPETVRLLLTGQTDLDSAVLAINQGQIFRFLTKPCPPDVLGGAIDAAVELHRLRTGERILLEQTLRGSLEALMGILSLANPLAFGRAARIKRTVAALAQKLGVESAWEVEIAAMLSQVGAITLPQAVVDSLYRGSPLDEADAAKVAEVPLVAARLIRSIPRLDGVQAILAAQVRVGPDAASTGTNAVAPSASLGAAILRLAIERDQLEAQGVSPDDVIVALQTSSQVHDARVLKALAEVTAGAVSRLEIREVRLAEVRCGMVLAVDLRNTTGVLLAPRGFEVTEASVARFRNFRVGTVQEPIRVFVPAAGEAAGSVCASSPP